ncbi:hypothetical protein lbkm_0123 [Lachnospiraceae bacterium KM106-2]|nr:hypothetical protein lbkm_0123 [Lachnospiraceae bacterium KM106-2]
MKELVDNLYFKTTTFLKVQKERFFSEERGGAEIIAVIVLVAVAVALGIAFKTEIKKFADSLWLGITGNKDAVTNKY